MGSDGVEVELVIPTASTTSTSGTSSPPPVPGRPHLPSTGFNLVVLLALAVSVLALGALVVRLSISLRRSA